MSVAIQMVRTVTRKFAALLWFLLFAVWTPLLAQSEFPKAVGYVNDFANVISVDIARKSERAYFEASSEAQGTPKVDFYSGSN